MEGQAVFYLPKEQWLREFGATARGRGLVHHVREITVAHGWDKGEWRYVICRCEMWLRHHPKKRDFRAPPEAEVNCLECLAGRRWP